MVGFTIARKNLIPKNNPIIVINTVPAVGISVAIMSFASLIQPVKKFMNCVLTPVSIKSPPTV